MKKSSSYFYSLLLIFFFIFYFAKVSLIKAEYTFTVEVTYQGDIYNGDPVINGKVTASALYYISNNPKWEVVAGKTDDLGKVILTLFFPKEHYELLILQVESVDKEFAASEIFYPTLPSEYEMKISFPSLNIKHYYMGKGNSEAFSFAIIIFQPDPAFSLND